MEKVVKRWCKFSFKMGTDFSFRKVSFQYVDKLGKLCMHLILMFFLSMYNSRQGNRYISVPIFFQFFHKIYTNKTQ